MRTLINRRQVVQGGIAAAAVGSLAAPALAAGKPEKLVFLCVVGGWGRCSTSKPFPHSSRRPVSGSSRHCCRQCKTHCPESAAGNITPGLVQLRIAAGDHLVLADIGNNNGVSMGKLI